MTDTSVFFRSKPVFWSFVCAPVIIRIVVMLALSTAARQPEETYQKETLLAEIVPVMSHAIDSNRSLLQTFQNQQFSSKERFLTDAAELLYKVGIKGSTQVAEEKMKSGLNKYIFTISGSAPTLHDVSRLLDEAKRLHYLRVSGCRISERSAFERTSYDFSITFERVELDTGDAL